jgi:hypothetical protein
MRIRDSRTLVELEQLLSPLYRGLRGEVEVGAVAEAEAEAEAEAGA